MAKRLREIITERYPDDYEQKTEVGKSFVAMHRDSKIINKLGAKGGTEDQFKGGTKEAPFNKQSNDAGFPQPGENDEYNLPTHYGSRDGGPDEDEDYVEDDNDIDNTATRSRIGTGSWNVDEEEINEAQPSQKEIRAAEKTLAHGRFRKNDVKDAEKGLARHTKKEEIEHNTFLDHLEEQSLTRKHFREVANTVRAIEDPKKRAEYAQHHAGIFAKANPRFSFEKFYAAAGTPMVVTTKEVPRKK